MFNQYLKHKEKAVETETKLRLFEYATVDDTRVEKLSLLVMKIVTTDRVQVIFWKEKPSVS